MKDKNIKVNESWIKHTPENVTTENDVIIMWDTPIVTDKKVAANRPDITIHDVKNKTCTFIDISVPVCCNIVKKKRKS